jgi:RNA polymerase sigma-70 factor (ECF subfamily)
MADTNAEQDLLEGAGAFDEAALSEIYARYSPELYRYAIRLLGDVQLAEDCVADTFSRFLQALRRGRRPRANLRAYLYRVAHNWMVDQFRRSPPDPAGLDPELAAAADSDPGQTIGARLERENMRRALLTIKPEQRQVLVLRYLEGFSIEEASAALGKSIGAVKALQHRALAALRRRLEQIEEIG